MALKLVSNRKPDPLELLEASWAEHEQPIEQRRHPLWLRALAWTAEKEWRIIALIGAALIAGATAGLFLP